MLATDEINRLAVCVSLVTGELYFKGVAVVSMVGVRELDPFDPTIRLGE